MKSCVGKYKRMGKIKEKERQEAEIRKKGEEKRAEDMLRAKIEKEKKAEADKFYHKTDAKAKGLKSVFLYDDGNGPKLNVVSFLDDRDEDDDVKYPHIEMFSDTEGTDKKLELRKFEQISYGGEEKEKQKTISIRVKNKDGQLESIFYPTALLDKGDYLGIKKILERKYFGGEFENDNLRMQIAYNFLDIKKILSLYISYIVGSISNIVSGYYESNGDKKNRIDDDFSRRDVIGNIASFSDYTDFMSYNLKLKNEPEKNKDKIEKNDNLEGFLIRSASDGCMRKLNFFFPKVFKTVKSNNSGKTDSDKKELNKAVEHNYDVLRAVSFIRQCVEHEEVSFSSVFKKRNEYEYTDLFLNGEDALESTKLKGVFESMFDKRIEKLKSVPKNLGNTYYILKRYYGSKTEKEKRILFERLCRNKIFKDYKNVGVNIGKLREFMVARHFDSLTEKEWDSCRSLKINKIIDFVLYEYLVAKGQNILEDMIDELRSSKQESLEYDVKDKIYWEYAERIYKGIGNVDALVGIIKKEKEKKEDEGGPFSGKDASDDSLLSSLPESCARGFEGVSAFAKIICFMGEFLDNKDINILIDTLISKFDSMADLIDCVGYAKKQSAISFAIKKDPSGINFRKISMDLRFVKNLEKMPLLESKNYEAELYKDALMMLGVDESSIRDKARWEVIENRIYKKEKNKKTLKNFLINNVIKSRWFGYVGRNYNPAKCRLLMSNRSLLNFVFKDIPETQIDRYCGTIGCSCIGSLQSKIDSLIDILLNYSFLEKMNEIENLTDHEKKEQEEGSRFEKLKKTATLYLTVLYLIVRGLLRVNARFMIAFSCLDRDKELLKEELGYDKKSLPKKKHELLTEWYLNRDEQIYNDFLAEKRKATDPSISDEDRDRIYSEAGKIYKRMHFKSRVYKYIRENYQEAKELGLTDRSDPSGAELTFVKFRNYVAHFRVLAEVANLLEDECFRKRFSEIEFASFYSLYRHFLLVSLIKGCLFGNQEFFDRKFADYETNLRTQEKMMWELNIPFAYNLARYKNLSIENLFNDRDIRQREKAQKNKSNETNTL